MKKIIYFLLLLCFSIQIYADGFKIRGVLPWHNFTCGPSGWNLKDYEKYLDDCSSQGINFIGFHNYTGGGERYASYVEPMIKISYKNILPEAYFDNSTTCRWGNVPLPIDKFPYGMGKYVDVVDGTGAFGSDCSLLSNNKSEHYENAQNMMKEVLRMAHDRGMEMAMGFEFGVIPPEYFSLSVPGDYFYWLGKANMVPNPAHQISKEIHYAALDNLLETYPDIDWVWLWLNEHAFYSVDVDEALQEKRFASLYNENSHYFKEASSASEKFLGVWALEYIKLTLEYLKEKNSNVKLIIGGWGGSNQLPVLLQGLDRALPSNVVFSCLNPGMGTIAQPSFLEDIAKRRDVIAVPWLEGDDQLWHFQPRINLMKEHVQLAANQNLAGVVAIHWRTEDVKYNFRAFCDFARNPGLDDTVEDLYEKYFSYDFGKTAAKILSPLFAEMDIARIGANISSPEFFAFSPSSWGVLDAQNIEYRQNIIKAFDKALNKEKKNERREKLEDLKAVFQFELLLDEVVKKMQPMYHLKKRFFENNDTSISKEDLKAAYIELESAPIKSLLEVFASRINSRGEMAIFCSINQRIWTEYNYLLDFYNKM